MFSIIIPSLFGAAVFSKLNNKMELHNKEFQRLIDILDTTIRRNLNMVQIMENVADDEQDESVVALYQLIKSDKNLFYKLEKFMNEK